MINFSSPLWQADAKVEWARTNLRFAVEFMESYLERGMAAKQSYNERTNLWDINFEAAQFDIILPLSIGASFHSLRSALDTAISILLTNATGKTSTRSNFPMHETENQLRATFEDGERTCPDCRSVRAARGGNADIRDKLPDLEKLIFENFKPWRDGNFQLWALGKMDNIHKHRLIMPILGEVSWKGSFSAEFPGGNTMKETASTFILNPGGIFPLVKGASVFRLDTGKYAAEVIFKDDPLAGVPVIGALENSIELVSGILETLHTQFQGS